MCGQWISAEAAAGVGTWGGTDGVLRPRPPLELHPDLQGMITAVPKLRSCHTNQRSKGSRWKPSVSRSATASMWVLRIGNQRKLCNGSWSLAHEPLRLRRLRPPQQQMGIEQLSLVMMGLSPCSFAMRSSAPCPAEPSAASANRQRLLQLLRQEPRGSANRQREPIKELIRSLEQQQPADLSASGAMALLEGVWELRWSSSQQPYLAVAPWLENLQCLAPSQGRGMNLLRLPGPLSSLAGIAVEAAITVQPRVEQDTASAPLQRVQVRFQRGGWLGPSLGGSRLQWLRTVSQSFPAWLDITVLDDELRICRGNAGTLFALLRRRDLSLEEMLIQPSKSETHPV